MLGMLFGGVCLAVAGYTLLFLSFSAAAKVVGLTAVGVFLLLVIYGLWRHHKNKPGKAPVGPLSPDERVKAQAKLLRAKMNRPPSPDRGLF